MFLSVITVAGTPNLSGFDDGVQSGAQFNSPSAAAQSLVAPTRVYVCDTGNDAIRAVDLTSGTVCCIVYDSE